MNKLNTLLDAFGSAHRAHSSVSGVAGLLPHAGGLLLEAEVTALGKLLDGAERAIPSLTPRLLADPYPAMRPVARAARVSPPTAPRSGS